MALIKPPLLKPGDTVAAISLSWGGAGELKHRYETGKKQLEDQFGLHLVETKNALKPADYIAKNPQARAEDLFEAFSDKSIKAIISAIGGEDSILTLPFTNLAAITRNPKIFLGFSDTTVTHFACYKAGLTSFYGTSLLVGFAENGGMHTYQVNDIRQTFFSAQPVGRIAPNDDGWTSSYLDWADPSLQNIKRPLTKAGGWHFLQGKGLARGRLIGGCLEVMEFIKATEYWPGPSEWENKILFLETSEEMMEPSLFRRILRNYAAQGLFEKISGLLFGRPYHGKYTEAYNQVLLQVIRQEQANHQLPIITEMDFGHTCPTFTLPYGILAEIDCDQKLLRFLESGVSEANG